MRRYSRFSRTLKSCARLCCFALLVVGASQAGEATLDEAKAAGQVGEAPDGYVHLVDSGAPADVKALVKDVNTKRKAKYASIAKKRDLPIEAVAVQAGTKLVERTPSGRYVMDGRSKWKKK